MGSSPITRSPFSQSPPFFLTKPLNFFQATSSIVNPKPIYKNPQILRCKSDPTSRKPQNPQRSSLSCLTISQNPITQSPSVSEKVQSLDFEFRSLPEPIERVKRLLHYAALLPPSDESLKVGENRVSGCTALVWMEAKMEGNGAMRFRIDSDSEITKGFCSCLIWVLDGAGADEVLSVEIDDLVEMNVGLPSRGKSRVNTWHNVLISMQKRTKDLVEENCRVRCQGLCSMVAVDGRSCSQTQVCNTFEGSTWSRSQLLEKLI